MAFKKLRPTLPKWAQLEWANDLGVSSPEFRGKNYISVYWGDDDAQPIRPLTPDEHNEVNRLLSTTQ